LLAPFSYIFRGVSAVRKRLHQKQSIDLGIPVIVVGNLSVGGTGKTPLVIAVAEKLMSEGIKVAVISRGFKAKSQIFPLEVGPDDKAELVGDEPLLMARQLNCPVIIAPKRLAAIRYLKEHYRPDIIISDDGLQHYAMPRKIEIAVLDGKRMLGNGYCLPAGPLREPEARLRDVDMVVVNGASHSNYFQMTMVPQPLVSMTGQRSISEFRRTYAVAGIGNPERFYDTLSEYGLKFHKENYPDHYSFSQDDFDKSGQNAIVMTEKDAVKCVDFADDRMFYLSVKASLDDTFWQKLLSQKSIQDVL
jgi:tetraacyldisaccharide 4'-kinase